MSPSTRPVRYVCSKYHIFQNGLRPFGSGAHVCRFAWQSSNLQGDSSEAPAKTWSPSSSVDTLPQYSPHMRRFARGIGGESHTCLCSQPPPSPTASAIWQSRLSRLSSPIGNCRRWSLCRGSRCLLNLSPLTPHPSLAIKRQPNRQYSTTAAEVIFFARYFRVRSRAFSISNSTPPLSDKQPVYWYTRQPLASIAPNSLCAALGGGLERGRLEGSTKGNCVLLFPVPDGELPEVAAGERGVTTM